MGRRTHTRVLAVWMNGELVGRWTLGAGGAQKFAYADTWLASEFARPISLSLPLRPGAEPYRAGVAEYFENLLPDNDEIRRRMQQRLGAESTRAFDLLESAGRDCVGAIQLVPEGTEPPDVRQITGQRVDRPQVAEVLRATLGTGFGRQGAEDDKAFRLSLAGAQEKTALLLQEKTWMIPTGATPTSHILKLPIGHLAEGLDLSTSVENEWLCAQILREFGTAAAHCQIETFGDFKTLVVERFDRKLSDNGKWWLRLPQEDLCQAHGLSPSKKYEHDGGPGVVKIMTLLLGSREAEKDRRDFMKRQLIFWLLAAIDGHAKNFSVFLLPGGRFQLTPSYDVLSAHPMLGHGKGLLPPQRIKLAMAIEGNNRHYHWNGIRARHWRETARRCGLPGIDELMEEVVAQATGVAVAIERQMPKGFPARVAATILGGMTQAARDLGQELAKKSA